MKVEHNTNLYIRLGLNLAVEPAALRLKHLELLFDSNMFRATRLSSSGLRRLNNRNSLFSSQRFASGEAAVKASEAVNAAASALPDTTALFQATPGVELGWSPTDIVMSGIENLHLGWQIPYWEAIVVTTIGMRMCMLPLGIKTAQGSARMAVVRPKLEKVTEAMKTDPNASQMNRKKAYAEQSRELLKQVSLTFKWILLYTFSILFPIEWCIRQLCSPSIISHNIARIAHNHHTDIPPLNLKNSIK